MSETQQNPEIDFKTTKSQINLQDEIRANKVHIAGGTISKGYEGVELEAFNILTSKLDTKEGLKNYEKIQKLSENLGLDPKQVEQEFEEGLYYNLKAGYRMKLYKGSQDTKMIDQIVSSYTISFRQTLNNFLRTKNNNPDNSPPTRFVLNVAKRAYMLEPNIYVQLTKKFPDVELGTIKRFIVKNPKDTEETIKSYVKRVAQLQVEYANVDLGVIKYFALSNPTDAGKAIDGYVKKIPELQSIYPNVDLNVIKQFAKSNPKDTEETIKSYVNKATQLQAVFPDIDLSVIKHFSKSNPNDNEKGIEDTVKAINGYMEKVSKLQAEYPDVDLGVIKHFVKGNLTAAEKSIKAFIKKVPLLQAKYPDVDLGVIKQFIKSNPTEAEKSIIDYIEKVPKLQNVFPNIDLGIIKHFAKSNPKKTEEGINDTITAINGYLDKVSKLQVEYPDVDLGVIKQFVLSNPKNTEEGINDTIKVINDYIEKVPKLQAKYPSIAFGDIKHFAKSNPTDTEKAIRDYLEKVPKLQNEFPNVDLSVLKRFARSNPKNTDEDIKDSIKAIRDYLEKVPKLQNEFPNIDLSVLKYFAKSNPDNTKEGISDTIKVIRNYILEVSKLQTEYPNVDLSVIKRIALSNRKNVKEAINDYIEKVPQMQELFPEVDLGVIKHFVKTNPKNIEKNIENYQERLENLTRDDKFKNISSWVLKKAALYIDPEKNAFRIIKLYNKIHHLYPYQKPEAINKFVEFIEENIIIEKEVLDEDSDIEGTGFVDQDISFEDIEKEWEKQLIAGEKLTPAERQTNNVFGSLRFTLTLVEEFCQNEALKLHPEKKQYYEKVEERINKILKFTSYLQNEDERFLYHDQKQELEHQKKHPNDKVSIFTPLGNWLNNSEYKFVNIMIRPDAYLGNSKNGDSEPRLKITFTPKQKEAEQFSFRIDIDSDSGEIVFDLEVLKDIDSQLINLMDHLEFEEKDTSRDMIKNIFTHHFNSNISTRNGLPKFKEIMEEFVKVFQKNKNHTPIKLN